MAHAEKDFLLKAGKVNEMCKEWLVREDGALAYQLQNQEISEHYKGNKQRNALVREDFPRALNEQLQEQQLAEEAARVYHQMLEEQEKIDSQYAKELAQKLEWEEKCKRQALQMQDQLIAKQVHEESNFLNSEFLNASSHFPSRIHAQANNWPQSSYHCHTPRRQAKPMPLPTSDQHPKLSISHENSSNLLPDVHVYTDPYLDTNTIPHEIYEYSEVYKDSNSIDNDLSHLQISDSELPIDEVIRRKLQEQKDAELARELQEQENCTENTQVDRDRLLAMEAQDKELAKLLQERERQKVRRAKERARQKKQQMEKSQMNQSLQQEESYSDPVDLLPPPADIVLSARIQHPTIKDDSYSLPIDVVKRDAFVRQISKTSSIEDTNLGGKAQSSPARPTNLNLKIPKKLSGGDKVSDSEISSPQHISTDSPSKLSNIAIAIDPTYNRRSRQFSRNQGSSPTATSSSTGDSSSPSVYDDENGPVPPYMPIQGQRRTSSLEKKSKKNSKVKDGCKQQ